MRSSGDSLRRRTRSSVSEIPGPGLITGRIGIRELHRGFIYTAKQNTCSSSAGTFPDLEGIECETIEVIASGTRTERNRKRTSGCPANSRTQWRAVTQSPLPFPPRQEPEVGCTLPDQPDPGLTNPERLLMPERLNQFSERQVPDSFALPTFTQEEPHRSSIANWRRRIDTRFPRKPSRRLPGTVIRKNRNRDFPPTIVPRSCKRKR